VYDACLYILFIPTVYHVLSIPALFLISDASALKDGLIFGGFGLSLLEIVIMIVGTLA
jgi:hypothetical protein